MLTSVHIQGYKSLSDVRLELGRLNVIVGANGAGKTNLLEAIGLLGCAAAGTVDDNGFLSRGIRPGLPALYKTALRGRGRIRRYITLEVSAAGAAYRISLDNPIASPTKAWRIANEHLESGGRRVASRSANGARMAFELGGALRPVEVAPRASIAKRARGVHGGTSAGALLDALDSFAIYTPFTPMLRGTTPDASQRGPLGLAGGRLPEALAELTGDATGQEALRRALELIDWASAVKVGSAAEARLSPAVATTRNVLRFRDRFMSHRRAWLSGFDASEGALYVLFSLALAAHPNAPPVCAVDNVDQALNPRLARALLSAVQDTLLGDPTRPQMILTVHNAQALDALDLAHDQVRLFTVSRDRAGATLVRAVDLRAVLRAKQAHGGAPLSQLWVEGWLGGMPDL